MKKDPQPETQSKKETWTTPQLTELDIRSTETNIGNGSDGGGGGFNAS